VSVCALLVKMVMFLLHVYHKIFNDFCIMYGFHIFSSLRSSGKHNRRVSFGPVHEYHPKTYEEREEELLHEQVIQSVYIYIL